MRINLSRFVPPGSFPRPIKITLSKKRSKLKTGRSQRFPSARLAINDTNHMLDNGSRFPQFLGGRKDLSSRSHDVLHDQQPPA
jgi:hypothetical protein